MNASTKAVAVLVAIAAVAIAICALAAFDQDGGDGVDPNSGADVPEAHDGSENGFVMITKEQLIKYGPMANLSERTINALLSTGQDEFYFTTSPPSCVIIAPDGSIIESEPYKSGFSWAKFAEFCAAQEAAEQESDRSHRGPCGGPCKPVPRPWHHL